MDNFFLFERFLFLLYPKSAWGYFEYSLYVECFFYLKMTISLRLRWDEMILSENWITLKLHHLEASWLSNFVLCSRWFRPDSIFPRLLLVHCGNTGLWLVNADHVTSILASDWLAGGIIQLLITDRANWIESSLQIVARGLRIERRSQLGYIKASNI